MAAVLGPPATFGYVNRIARNRADYFGGILLGEPHLLMDRDAKFFEESCFIFERDDDGLVSQDAGALAELEFSISATSSLPVRHEF
jgi:hypothetical protein